MGEIISGKALSKEVREEVRINVEALKAKYNAVPHLAVVLVGEDPASQSYVKAKKRACLKAGMNDYITKPVIIEKLSHSLQNVHRRN